MSSDKARQLYEKHWVDWEENPNWKEDGEEWVQNREHLAELNDYVRKLVEETWMKAQEWEILESPIGDDWDFKNKVEDFIREKGLTDEQE